MSREDNFVEIERLLPYGLPSVPGGIALLVVALLGVVAIPDGKPALAPLAAAPLVYPAIRAARWARRARRRREGGPRSAWHWPWRRDGAVDVRALLGPWRVHVLVGVAAAICGVAVLQAYAQGVGGGVVAVGAVGLGLGVAAVAYGVHVRRRLARVDVTWERCPVAVDRPFHLTFHPPEALPRGTRLVAELRRVEEYEALTGSGLRDVRHRLFRRVPDVVTADAVVDGGPVRLDFPRARAPRPTRFRDDGPPDLGTVARGWELVVRAEPPEGPRFERAYLVPVYEEG